MANEMIKRGDNPYFVKELNAGDTPKSGPVWQLGDELHDDKYLPDRAELDDLKSRLNTKLEKLWRDK